MAPRCAVGLAARAHLETSRDINGVLGVLFLSNVRLGVSGPMDFEVFVFVDRLCVVMAVFL